MAENKKLFELADRLKGLKDEKYAHEDAVKALNAEIDAVTGEMIEIMTGEEVSGFHRNGSQFSLSTTEYPGPAEGRKDELYECLRTEGYETLFSVNSQTLRGFVNDLKSDNEGQLPDWLDGLIAENPKTIIRITKGRKVQ